MGKRFQGPPRMVELSAAEKASPAAGVQPGLVGSSR